jgi:hypothetical protein
MGVLTDLGIKDGTWNSNTQTGTQTPTSGPINMTQPTNVPVSTPPVTPTAGTATIVAGSPTMSTVLTPQQWLTQIGTMPTGGWTLSDGSKTTDQTKAYNDYKAKFQATPADPSQINVADYAGQVATNPSLALTGDNPATSGVNESMRLEDHLKSIDENAPGTTVGLVTQGATPTAATTQAATAQAAAVDPREAVGYDATQTQTAVEGAAMTGATGTVNPNAQIDAPQVDMQGTATGTNADGSVNYTGEALKEFAELGLDDVDAKATVKGQMDILQADFTGPNGEPRIPPYAAGLARNVSKIAAFKGMTGSAATAAMAQALMEASLPIAQQDAQFFQTLTLQNLSNKQQSTINRANVLAKMDQVNVDNRMAAAIQNSKNFMDMDLKNLDNAQQAAVINTQARIQSILEDAKAVNAERLFTADATNEMGKFYDNLGAQIEQFNTNQANQMNQFNTGETNAQSRFNSDLENQRDQFYKTMQYNIDTANAKWRQTVTLTESEQQFEAAAADVKNLVGISVEQMNQLWDRSDALLDYIWKSTESELDRKAALLLADKQADQADKAGWGSIFGSIAGAVAGSDQFLDWVF